MTLAPALYWKLDAASGSFDMTGNGRHGTANGGIALGGHSATSPGIVGESATCTDFDGTNDRITTSYSPFLPASTVSVTGWSFQDLDHTGVLFGSQGAADVNNVAFFCNASQPTFSFRASNASGANLSDPIGAGAWFFWVLVFNEATDAISLYINGSLSSTNTTPQNYSTPGGFQLGAKGADTFFDGKMAHVAVYEYALTASQVFDLYQFAFAGPLFLRPKLPGGSFGNVLNLEGVAGARTATDGLELPPPSYEEEFSSSPDSEGGFQVSSASQNVEASVKTMLYADDQTTFYSRVRNWERSIELARGNGGELIYTPAGGATITYDVVSAAVTEAPLRHSMLRNNVTVGGARFVCLPYGRLTTVTSNLSIVDRFNYDTIGGQRWIFDAGSGTLSVSGGQLVPSSIASKRLYYRSQKCVDGTVYVSFFTGSTITSSWDTDLVLKRLDSTNYLKAVFGDQGGGWHLALAKVDGGVPSNLSTLATGGHTWVAITQYWASFNTTGNVLTANLYNTDPLGSNPTAAVQTLSFTLAGADATKFGVNIKGFSGLEMVPKDTNQRWDDFRADSTAWESTEPINDFHVFDVPGQVPALGKMTVTDAGTQARRHLDVAWDDRWESHSAPFPKLLDSDILDLTGMAGVGNTRSFAFDPAGSGNSVIRGTLRSVPTTICGTGTQVHVGPQRIKARVFCTGTGPYYARLLYRVGTTGPFTASDWELGVDEQWTELDFGTITIPDMSPSTQSWEGRIEAYTGGVSGDIMDIDFVEVLPAQKFCNVSGDIDMDRYSTLSAFSDASTESGVITGDSLAIGGVWTLITGGDTDDFSQAAGILTRAPGLADTGTTLGGGRGVTAGTTSFSDVVAQVDILRNLAAPNLQGLALRSDGNTNGVLAVVNGSIIQVVLYTGATLVQQFTALHPINTWYTLRVGILSNGYWAVWYGVQNGTLTLLGSGFRPEFASGTLASGRVGIYDQQGGVASSRSYDNFAAWVPTDFKVIETASNVAVRHDAVVKADGSVLAGTGSHLRINPAGREGRAASFAVKARRNNVAASPTGIDEQIADATKVSLDLTPRVVLLG